MTLIQTLRTPRIGSLAVFDFATAFAGMWIVAPRLGVSRERALWATVPLGVVVHQVLGIDTPLNRMVFGSGHWPVKVVVAGLALKALMVRGAGRRRLR